MAAGDKIPWSYIATRVATGTITSDSSTWNGTESGSLVTVSPTLVSGLTYAVRVFAHVSTSSIGSPNVELSVIRVRIGSASGTQILGSTVYLGSTNGNGYSMAAYGEYTADADGAEDFVLTGQRVTGAGNHQIRAGTTRPTYLLVDLLPS